MIRSAFAVALLLGLAAPAHADEPRGDEPPVQELILHERTTTWPFTLDLHLLIGAEPHDQGTPVAFGIGAEVLWHGWLGGFVSLLASEGAPIPATTQNGKALPSLPDRVSVPFGLAVRPFSAIAAMQHNSESWLAELARGVGAQLGVTIEHLRSSDDTATTAGLHAAVTVDVPIYGGPLKGGVALRLMGRLIVTPSATLETNKSIAEPAVSGQLFAGVCYTP